MLPVTTKSYYIDLLLESFENARLITTTVTQYQPLKHVIISSDPFKIYRYRILK